MNAFYIAISNFIEDIKLAMKSSNSKHINKEQIYLWESRCSLKYLKMTGVLKKLIISVSIGCLAVCIYIGQTVAMQNNLANHIIRLHVIANSNSEQDQMLKLQVRDKIAEKFADILSISKNIEQTRKILRDNIEDIRNVALQEIRNSQDKQSDYDVEVKLEKMNFHTKSYYHSWIMPAGKYEAIQVIIGSGQGENWWGVIYPMLSITSRGHVVKELKKSDVKTAIKCRYSGILVRSYGEKISLRFKILDKISDLHDRLKKSQTKTRSSLMTKLGHSSSKINRTKEIIRIKNITWMKFFNNFNQYK